MAEFSDLSEMQSYSNEKLDNPVGANVDFSGRVDVIKLITKEIIQVLQLTDNENRDQILTL